MKDYEFDQGFTGASMLPCVISALLISPAQFHTVLPYQKKLARVVQENLQLTTKLPLFAAP
jgi:hypothetical protein